MRARATSRRSEDVMEPILIILIILAILAVLLCALMALYVRPGRWG